VGLELARVWVRIRADASQLKGDFRGAQSVAVDQSKKISNIINNNITVRQQSLGLKLKRLFVGIGAASLAKEMFGLAASLETTTTSMRVMLGSAEKAKGIIDEIRKLSLTSPFSFEELTLNTKQLLAYGIASKDLIKTVKALAGVVAATDADFGRLALAYGQVRSKGRLQAQEIRQFTEATVPLVQLLAAEMGKSSGEVLKLVEEGKVGFSEVEKVMFGLTEGTGRYTGILSEMSKTLSGSFNILKNYIKFILTDLGTSLMPVLKGVINIAISLGDKLKRVFDNVNSPLMQWANNVADVLNTISKNLGLTWELLNAQFKVSSQFISENWQTLMTNTLPVYAKAGAKAIWEIFKGLAASLGDLFGNFFNIQKDIAQMHVSGSWLARADVYQGQGMERSAAEKRAWDEMTQQIVDRWTRRGTKGFDAVMKNAMEAASSAYAKEVATASKFKESPVLKKLKKDRDKVAEQFAKALEMTRNRRLAEMNIKGVERPELSPDVGLPETAKNKKTGSSMVGIAALGRQIQQELLDVEAEHRRKVEKFWNENNRQNDLVIHYLKETSDKWDNLPDFGGLA